MPAEATPRRLLLVYHSVTGGTCQMAAAALAGARSEAAVLTTALPATEADATHVLAADGYLFASPENLATMAGVMKDFFDRCYYPVLDRINGRPYASMICAGSDGEGAARQIARITTGWRLRAVADPLIVRTHAQTQEAILAPKMIAPADLARCGELGAALAAGLAMGVF
jgi:multimeric flavodoxin WrbA